MINFMFAKLKERDWFKIEYVLDLVFRVSFLIGEENNIKHVLTLHYDCYTQNLTTCVCQLWNARILRFKGFCKSINTDLLVNQSTRGMPLLKHCSSFMHSEIQWFCPLLLKRNLQWKDHKIND